MVVLGSASSALRSHCCRSARVIESSAPNGSSSSRTSLPATRVRRKETRCRIPPDSWCGQPLLESGQAEPLDQVRHLVTGRLAPHPPVLQGERRVAEHVAPGQQQVALRHPGAAAQPALGGIRVEDRDRCPRWARPARMIIASSVDFPQPLGPTMARRPCSGTSRSTPDTATVSPNARATPRTCTPEPGAATPGPAAGDGAAAPPGPAGDRAAPLPAGNPPVEAIGLPHSANRISDLIWLVNHCRWLGARSRH